MSMTRSHERRSWRRSGPAVAMPAFATTTSSPPRASAAASIAALTASASDTSQRAVNVPSPHRSATAWSSSGSRPTSASRAPWAASASARAAPIPRAAPVMRTRFPLSTALMSRWCRSRREGYSVGHMTTAAPNDTARRLDALLAVGLRLARSAPTGRVALAQFAGVIDPEWIPQPWGEEIVAELAAAAEAANEPIPFAAVERILREAWGERPDRELDELEPEPVLCTPVAQVHRAVHEGTSVAIKVLRPGLAGLIRQDLALLETLAAPLSAAFPALDVGPLLREVRERVL